MNIMKNPIEHYTSIFDEFLSKTLEKIDSKFRVTEMENEFVLSLPLAGYAKKDTKVSFNHKSRILTVTTNSPALGKQENSITLGEEYNVASLVASMSNGLLTIKMGKLAVSAVKDIEIK